MRGRADAHNGGTVGDGAYHHRAHAHSGALSDPHVVAYAAAKTQETLTSHLRASPQHGGRRDLCEVAQAHVA